MSSLLVVHNDHALFPEKEDVFNQLREWTIHYIDSEELSVSRIIKVIKKCEIHFLLFSRHFDKNTSSYLSKINSRFPLISVIYYNSQLKSGEFAELSQAGINYCIIGDARQINLIKTLKQLWDVHWKRIPPNLIPESSDPRMNEIIRYIERNPLSSFNSYNLAEALHISESYFRNEFKRIFGVSFRVFKQKLLHYYEMDLLFNKKLRPSEVYDVLNYKNISAFSRSFKSRHGQSWQKMMRQHVR